MKRISHTKQAEKLDELKEKQTKKLEKLKETQELQLEKLRQSEKLEKLKKSKKINRLTQFFKEIASYHVSLYAANASFYIILAFFPFIMLVVSLLSAFGISQGDLLTALSGILPNVLMPLMERVINDMSTNSTLGRMPERAVKRSPWGMPKADSTLTTSMINGKKARII